MILALTDTTEHWWWGALAAGAVVLLAVVALLTILVLLVRTIDERTLQIRETLKRAADNTSDTALIGETAKQVDAVLAEGLEHHLFLGRVLDKVRSCSCSSSSGCSRRRGRRSSGPARPTLPGALPEPHLAASSRSSVRGSALPASTASASARIEIATFAGVSAPMSRPAGPWMRPVSVMPR